MKDPVSEIILSIDSYWLDLILKGEKLRELRKTIPTLDHYPVRCYMYCTKNSEELRSKDGTLLNGKIVGEFICYSPEHIEMNNYDKVYEVSKLSQVSVDEMQRYSRRYGYLWSMDINKLKVYSKPKYISDFYKSCSERCCSTCRYQKHVKYGDDNSYCYTPIDRPPQSWRYCTSLKKISEKSA